MGHHIAASIGTATKLPSQYDRRHASRTPTLFSLFYSYMESGQVLIGERNRHTGKSIGRTRLRSGPLYRPSWNGQASYHFPKPCLLD
jgi:hypothetical protein